MAGSEARTRGTALVPGAHRVIRQLDAGEGPYAGALVNSGASVAVLMDSESISGWAAWEHAGDEHVAAPLDVVRRHDGHDVLLPWCTERVTAFLGRRAAAEIAVSSGEITTLVASVLRALGELTTRDGRIETGDWWLTDDGRPMFVIGQGEDARVSAARLIVSVQTDCTDRALARLLATIGEGVHKTVARPGMPARQLERWEAELLAIAAPRPLTLDAYGPERARDIGLTRRSLPETESRRDLRSRGADGPVPRGVATVVRDALAPLTRRMAAGRALLGGWADRRRPAVEGKRVREIRRGGWRKTPKPIPDPAVDGHVPVRRPRRLLVAGVAAAVVVGVGMLWPGGATGEPKAEPAPAASSEESAQDAPEESAPASPTPPVSPDAIPDASSSAEDPLVAMRALLASVRRCTDEGDEVCTAAVAEGSTGIVAELAPAVAGEPKISPVDEYGDVAVVRLSSTTGGEGEKAGGSVQMVVLVRMAEKWLVRDAYDVADQPG